ncbi:MAG: hypothetical protein GX660_15780 [Clostridiaceae bacterium]|nr:hypothetical protein [Clostridiaceae bacterium]
MKKVIKEIDIEILSYRRVAKYLDIVNKNKDIYSKYEKCNSFGIDEFFSKYEGGILSYEHAINKLDILNISIDNPLEKAIFRTNEFIQKIDK